MLIPSGDGMASAQNTSLSRRVNANSQPEEEPDRIPVKLIKKGEC